MKDVKIPRSWTWASIPMEIIESEKLSAHAKLLVGAVMSHAFDDKPCWPGQERLSQLCSCSVPTVYRATKELEEAGFLNVERRKGYSSIYRFISKTNLQTCDRGTSQRVMAPLQTCDRGTSQRVMDEVDEVKVDEISRKTSRRPSDDPPPSSDHYRFKTFWCSSFEERFGKKYMFTGRDAKIISEMLKVYSLEDLKVFTIAGWENKDKWIKDHCTSLISFQRQISAIIAQKPVEKKSIYDGQPGGLDR